MAWIMEGICQKSLAEQCVWKVHLMEPRLKALRFMTWIWLWKDMSKILGRAMRSVSTFNGTPTQCFKVYGLILTLEWYAETPWQSNVLGKYICLRNILTAFLTLFSFVYVWISKCRIISMDDWFNARICDC